MHAFVEELAALGSGASLSVSIDGRRQTYTAGFAYEGGPVVDGETRFNVASVSKLITASMVVALAHEGRIHLDDPIGIHLPGLRLVDAKGEDRARDITIAQLLAHRGGLPHHPSSLDPGAVGSSFTDPALIQRLAASWEIALAQEPGTYAYSNLGYVLLAAVIEKEAGDDFVSAAALHLRALGMDHSTFWPAALDQAAHGRIDGATFHPPGWYTSRYALPFTGLWTTTEDLLRFGEAMARSDAWSAMRRFEGEGPAYGLGPVRRIRHGHATLEHDGGGPGFVAWLITVPDADIHLAVTVNAHGESRENAQRFVQLVDQLVEVVLTEAIPGRFSQPARLLPGAAAASARRAGWFPRSPARRAAARSRSMPADGW